MKINNLQFLLITFINHFLLGHCILPSILNRPSNIFLQKLCAVGAVFFLDPLISYGDSSKKLTNLNPTDISSIVRDDVEKRQALITADFTRSIYQDNCQFQDEIDVYDIDAYIKGTKALFNPSKSHVDLIGDVTATDKEVTFKFSEYLTFNIPFNPRVDLTGRVVFTRADDGLISYSREFWDQPVSEVLKTIKFN